MRICIVTTVIEAHQVLMKFPDIDVVIKTSPHNLISTFFFRESCLYANTLKNVQSNFGWLLVFSPERHFTAPVLGGLDHLKETIKVLIPSTESVEYLEFHRLAKT